MVRVRYKVAGGEATAIFKDATTFWANSESGTLDVIQELKGERAPRGKGAETIAVFAAGEWIYAEIERAKLEIKLSGHFKGGSSLDSSQLAYAAGQP